MKAKIVIVDDHRILRDGIKALLKAMNNVLLVGEASNGVELQTLIQKKIEIDIILMDINMPLMNGFEATRMVKLAMPNVKIIVLSMYDDVQNYEAMIALGVDGFLLKESSYDELESAIKAVLDNRPYFSQSLLLKLIESKSTQKTLKFSKREKEVLEAICLGLSTLEIAEKLFLSISSIEKYRSELLLKTESANATALAVYAIRNNLVNL